MSLDQYMRKCRLLIQHKSNGTTYDVSGLRCAFSISKAVSDEAGYSTISIYNPAASFSGLIKKGDTVILEAGYETSYYGMIFTGNVVQAVNTAVDATTRILKMICSDGDVYLKSAFTATTLSQGATQKDAVSELIKSGDGSASRGDIADSIGLSKSLRGKTMFGYSADYLRQIGKSNSAQFYIEDGKINIVKAADYGSKTAVELNPGTGLVGTPDQTEDGVSGVCLINPRIKLNTLVHISAKLVNPREVDGESTKIVSPSTNGVYKIIKLTYEGDTRGDSWYILFDALAQSGMKPDGITGDQSNIWR